MGSIQKFLGGIFSGSGGGYIRGSFHGGGFHGGRDIAMKGVPDFPALFKKRSEIKQKEQTSFSTESKEQHQNLKRTGIITYMIVFAR